MDKPFEKRMLTASEVAQFLGFHESTVALWARIGHMYGTKIDGRWRFEEQDVHDFLADRGAATLAYCEECFERYSAKTKRA